MLEGMCIKYLSSVQGLLICAIPVFFTESMGWLAAGSGAGGEGTKGSDVSSRAEDYTKNRRYLISLAEAIGTNRVLPG